MNPSIVLNFIGIVFFLLGGKIGIAQEKKVFITFLDENIELAYDDSFIKEKTYEFTKENLKGLHLAFILSDNEKLLRILSKYERKKYKYNGVYVAFLKKITKVIGKELGEDFQRMLLWVLLTESAYNIPIIFNANGFILLGELNYELTFYNAIMIHGKPFIGIDKEVQPDEDYKVLEFYPEGIPISFDAFNIKTRKKCSKKGTIEKQFRGFNEATIIGCFDTMLMEQYTMYPNFGIDRKIVLKAPSKPLDKSLLKSLKKSINGKSYLAAIQSVLYFCRKNIKYKEDFLAGYKDRSRFPEETLYYQEGDCEDMVILAAFLLREIYNIHSILVIYKDHVDLGIISGTNESNWQTIEYQNRTYALTDITSAVTIGETKHSKKDIQQIIEVGAKLRGGK